MQDIAAPSGSSQALQPPPPPERFNVAAHLLGLNTTRAAKPAYIDDRRSLTYGELDERVRRCAAGLLALGLQREQRLLMVMHDRVDFPVAFLGAVYAGIVPVPVNALLTVDDYAFMCAMPTRRRCWPCCSRRLHAAGSRRRCW